MATQRYISTSFWDDEWIQTLDPSEKLLYLYLMTNPLTNIAGVYKITLRRICFDTGFNADTVGHILRKFETARKAYLHGDYIILPSWPQHQKADSRSKIKEGIDAIIKSLPHDMVMYMVSIGYRYHIEGYAYPRNYSDSDSDTDTDTEKEGESARASEPAAAPALREDAPSPSFSKPEAKTEELPLYGKFKNVALSDDDYQGLLFDYGEGKTTEYINRLSSWLAEDSGRKCENACAKITHWLIDDKVKPYIHTATPETRPEPEIEKGKGPLDGELAPEVQEAMRAGAFSKAFRGAGPLQIPKIPAKAAAAG